MVPGFSSDALSRLVPFLADNTTDIKVDHYDEYGFFLYNSRDAEARELGVDSIGSSDPLIVVTDPRRRLGHIRLDASGPDAVLFFDNSAWGGNFHANIRILGRDSFLLFNDIGTSYVALPELFLRSDRQGVFWGRMASAVGCSVELEGEGRTLVVGDDSLISAGVWIRNHDMHAIHDLHSGALLNPSPVDTVIERHVWLGQDALLLSCKRIGKGSIVGARALVKGSVPEMVAAAGIPARVTRRGVSWGRQTDGITEQERLSLAIECFASTVGASVGARSQGVATVVEHPARSATRDHFRRKRSAQDR